MACFLLIYVNMCMAYVCTSAQLMPLSADHERTLGGPGEAQGG